MAEVPKILRNFTAFIDGVGMAGLVTKATPPEFELVMEEHKSGGTAGAEEISLGALKMMTFPLTLAEVRGDIFNHLGREIGFTVRGSQGNGTVKEAVIYQMRGTLKQLKGSDWEPESKASLDCTFTVRKVTLTIGSVERVHYDARNMIFRVNGVDLFAEDRTALGL